MLAYIVLEAVSIGLQISRSGINLLGGSPRVVNEKYWEGEQICISRKLPPFDGEKWVERFGFGAVR